MYICCFAACTPRSGQERNSQYSQTQPEYFVMGYAFNLLYYKELLIMIKQKKVRGLQEGHGHAYGKGKGQDRRYCG